MHDLGPLPSGRNNVRLTVVLEQTNSVLAISSDYARWNSSASLGAKGVGAWSGDGPNGPGQGIPDGSSEYFRNGAARRAGARHCKGIKVACSSHQYMEKATIDPSRLTCGDKE